MSDQRSGSMEQMLHDFDHHGASQGEAAAMASVALTLQAGRPQFSLAHAVQVEIVPRLIRSHRTPAVPELLPDDVRAFAELVLARDADAASAHVEGLRAQGVPLEKIYLSLIAPAARLLKHQWLDDERDFAEVTLGLWRMQQVLRDFSTAFRTDRPAFNGLRALLAPGPAAPQDVGYLMFGLVLLGEFFRRDGWDTWIEPAANQQQLSTLLHNEWFDVVELMAGGGKRLDELAATIKAVRKASLNRSLGVIVCGADFVEHPELVMMVGGDLPAADPREAPAGAAALVKPNGGRA